MCIRDSAQPVFNRAQQKAPNKRQLSKIKAKEQKSALEWLLQVVLNISLDSDWLLEVIQILNENSWLAESFQWGQDGLQSLRQQFQREHDYIHLELENEIIQILRNEIVAHITEKFMLTNPII